MLKRQTDLLQQWCLPDWLRGADSQDRPGEQDLNTASAEYSDGCIPGFQTCFGVPHCTDLGTNIGVTTVAVLLCIDKAYRAPHCHIVLALDPCKAADTGDEKGSHQRAGHTLPGRVVPWLRACNLPGRY